MRVLILQAGFNELGVIKELHKMGHYVISIGNQVGLIGQKEVDEYYPVDYSKKEEVLAFVKEHKIDLVCACCNDTAVLTTTYLAEQLQLSGYDTYKNAQLIAHKDLFKKFAIENQILTAPAEAFYKEEEAKKYILKGVSYPIIVKPTDMSGGKGVSRCDTDAEAMVAIEQAFAISREKDIVIEPFIEGTQHGFCTFLHNKKVVACSSNDEYSVVNPYRVEIDTFPAKGIEKYRDILIAQVEKMAEVLNLEDGIFHIQYMEKDGCIYILEAMRRIIGNMYSVPASKSSEFDWDYWQARASIGINCVAVPERLEERGYYAYRAIIPPKNGIVKDVIVDEEVKKYIFDQIQLYEKGHVVTNYLTDTLGILFFQFGSEQEMKKIMLEYYDRIRVEMEDE